MRGLEFLRRMTPGRNRQGLSQHELAAAAGVGQKRISDYERGLVIPRKAARRLARALGIPEKDAQHILAAVVDRDALLRAVQGAGGQP